MLDQGLATNGPRLTCGPKSYGKIQNSGPDSFHSTVLKGPELFDSWCVGPWTYQNLFGGPMITQRQIWWTLNKSLLLTPVLDNSTFTLLEYVSSRFTVLAGMSLVNMITLELSNRSNTNWVAFWSNLHSVCQISALQFRRSASQPKAHVKTCLSIVLKTFSLNQKQRPWQKESSDISHAQDYLTFSIIFSYICTVGSSSLTSISFFCFHSGSIWILGPLSLWQFWMNAFFHYKRRFSEGQSKARG